MLHANENKGQTTRRLAGPRGRAAPALDVASCRWPTGTEVCVQVDGSHISVGSPTVRFVWDAYVQEASFEVTVIREVPEVVLRFNVEANGVPVAAP